MNMLKRIHFLAIALAFGCPAYALPPYAYIQRGLVAQWDGIDNAGTGTHVADTNAWTDLAGNCEPLSSAALSFVDGDCAWLQGKALETICSALPTVYSASTIEAHGYASKFTSHPSTDDLIGCGQGCSIFWQADSTKFGIRYVHDTTLKLYHQGHEPEGHAARRYLHVQHADPRATRLHARNLYQRHTGQLREQRKPMARKPLRHDHAVY